MCFVVGILGFTAILIHLLYTVSVAWLCIPLGLFGLLVAHEMQKDNDAKGWCITFEDGKPTNCEPVPDPFLNEERTLGKKWAWVSMAILMGAVGAVLLAAYSAMEQTQREPLWFAVAGILLVASQAVRFKKLRCPYCGKSVAPLKFVGSPRLACPRCGRIYRYEE